MLKQVVVVVVQMMLRVMSAKPAVRTMASTTRKQK
jgi:hypothetical protein